MSLASIKKVWTILAIFVFYTSLDCYLNYQGSDVLIDFLKISEIENSVMPVYFVLIFCIPFLFLLIVSHSYIFKITDNPLKSKFKWYEKIPYFNGLKIEKPSFYSKLFLVAILLFLYLIPFIWFNGHLIGKEYFKGNVYFEDGANVVPVIDSKNKLDLFSLNQFSDSIETYRYSTFEITKLQQLRKSSRKEFKKHTVEYIKYQTYVIAIVEIILAILLLRFFWLVFYYKKYENYFYNLITSFFNKIKKLYFTKK